MDHFYARRPGKVPKVAFAQKSTMQQQYLWPGDKQDHVLETARTKPDLVVSPVIAEDIHSQELWDDAALVSAKFAESTREIKLAWFFL